MLDGTAELERGRDLYAREAWADAYEPLSAADVERAFRGWKITDVEMADTEPDALARLFKFDERVYRLRRNGK
jgi:hypothetical protein